ncbi:MAG: GNAT family protein [Candidatus Altiarchaeota archaeon]|nr:GNAT family protein [Candidatus Altiarchaeota archaeon]
MNVSFRRTSVKDLRRLNELVNDPDVCRFLNLVLPVSMKSTREFYEDGGEGGNMLYSIIVDGEVAGSVCLRPRKKDSKQAHVAEFGISIGKWYWGVGVGGRAIDYIVNEGRKRGIKRIEFEVVADNRRARRLYVKHGFREEGRKKNSFIIDGRFHDTIVMARLLA